MHFDASETNVKKEAVERIVRGGSFTEDTTEKTKELQTLCKQLCDDDEGTILRQEEWFWSTRMKKIDSSRRKEDLLSPEDSIVAGKFLFNEIAGCLRLVGQEEVRRFGIFEEARCGAEKKKDQKLWSNCTHIDNVEVVLNMFSLTIGKRKDPKEWKQEEMHLAQ